MHKFPPSEEQLFIFQNILENKNVIVDAIAGAGKSSTIIAIAERLPNLSFLQITYNSMLRKEFKEKLKVLCLTNIEVHTFHSLAVKYFQSNAFTDTVLREILYNKLQPQTVISNFDIVILDECQDMTPLYYHFINYVFDFLPRQSLQLLILGDFMQCLYEFKGADSRFLTLADKLWSKCTALKTSNFTQCSLTTSYRITNQMAQFINHAMLDEPRIKACRDGTPVIYIRNTRSNIEKIVIYHIKRILEEGDLPSDIFILGSSVRGVSSNIRKLENVLVESGIPCHVPMLESDKIDDRVINGKVVFSTFHTVKGRQRKYVFVLGFDSSYFQIYSRNIPRTICPNTLYVACTRATHKLYLLESAQYATDKPLPFLKLSHHDMIETDYIDFKGNPQTIFYDKINQESVKDKPTTFQINITDLIRFIPESVLESITPIVTKIFFKVSHMSNNSKEYPIQPNDIPSIVNLSNDMYEDVSDLNGIAIPCIFYDKFYNKNDTSSLYKLIEMYMKDLKTNEYSYLKSRFLELNKQCTSIADYLYMSNFLLSCQEKLYFKLKQIEQTDYSWLEEDTVNKLTELLYTLLGNDEYLYQEKTIIDYSMENEHVVFDSVLADIGPVSNVKYRFKARIDFVTAHSIWEMKCTSQLSIEHMLQVVFYAWIWKLLYPDQEKKFILFNIKTGEMMQLLDDVDVSVLSSIIIQLIKGKYEQSVPLDETTFLQTFTNGL